LLLAALLPALMLHAETISVYKTKTGTGWLEKTPQGAMVLHLEGSYYDMGVQQAKLLSEQTQIAPRTIKHLLKKQIPVLPASWTMSLIDRFVFQKEAPFIPKEYLDEMQGLADASGVDLRMVHVAAAIAYITSCETAAAWGPATKDHDLYFIRSNDDFVPVDPLTKKSYADLRMVVVYKPIGEVPYVLINLPGLTGASDGMNAEGIAIGNMSLPSKYETAAGIPMQFRIKQALGKSHNLDQAVALMTAKPLEGGYNFIVADAKIPKAVAIEMNARNVYVGGWDGPAESNHYTFRGKEYSYQPVNGLIMRANHPLSSEILADFKGRIEHKGENFRTGQRYADLRARLVKNYGNLTLETMFEQLRESYLAMDYGDKPTQGATTWQVAFAPKSGEFLLAISNGDPMIIGRHKASAFNQPFYEYNFFTLLNSKPQ
jgi:predicted choloylglycine hydrolase